MRGFESWNEALLTCVGPDKPNETLETDSKFASGHNPVMTDSSPANK